MAKAATKPQPVQAVQPAAQAIAAPVHAQASTGAPAPQSAPQPGSSVQADGSQFVYVNLLNDVYIDDELNMREESRHSEEEVRGLAASIEESNGLLQPIGVHRTPKARRTEHDKPYELAFGFGRSRALKMLYETTQDPQWVERVPAMIKEESDSTRLQAEQLVENLQRKNTTQMETARKLKEIKDSDPTITVTRLGRITGWPVPTITNYLRMNNLDPQVQDMIGESTEESPKLSWSHAREIERLNLSPELQKQYAAIGVGKPYGAFKALLQKAFPEKFREEGEGEGGAEGAVSSGNGAAEGTTEGTQKSPEKAIRANLVKEKYLPYFEKQANEAKGKDKDKWLIRSDAAKFFLKEEGTQLEAELAPWEEQLAKEKEAKEAADKESLAKKAYVRAAITAIGAKLKEIPPEYNPDGTPNLKRELPTLPSVLATIKASVVADLEKGKSLGLPEKHVKSGEASFAVPDVDALIKEISGAYHEHLETRKKDQERRAAAKKEKEAKEAETAQTQTPVPATA